MYNQVKCSGERTGCQRCIGAGYNCQFGISMVGRCSKGRRRRKRSKDEVALDSDMRAASTARQACLLQGSVIEPTSPIDPDLASLLDWESYQASGLGGQYTNRDVNLTASTTEDALGAVLSQLDAAIPADDHSFGQQSSLTSSSSATSPAYPALPLTPCITATIAPSISENMEQEETPEETGNPNNETSLHVLFQVMSNLEAEMSDPNSSIDKAMHTVKTSIKEVQSIVQSRQWKTPVVGLMLALVVIDVALILIENVVSRWSHLGNRQVSGSLILGLYRAENEETTAIWGHIIMIELKRLQKLIEVLGAHLNGLSHCQNSEQMAGRLNSSCSCQKQKVALIIANLQGYYQQHFNCVSAS
ncbi:hypothetical protein TESG_00998 [Trichophyton tonsurans CBS 112818]|uniref:Zn(2)-C6 fungal-type domain-containing protein n=1 Tax=Trichophyton tonsurans (strain CBS 112818) TaxID=647933 RepID=F2RQ68_TRIT1|nr:hypothetical protein TESG_00998 [Trichophyton tonsurans CBS 112818]